MMVTKVHKMDKNIDVQPTANQQSLILLPITKMVHYTAYRPSKTVFICRFFKLFNSCLTEFDYVHRITV
jgi:hypothetical protein